MITKTQYRLLVDNYMEKYNISQIEAEFLINKHKMEYYINALRNDIIENYNISSL
jgi:hypothetical protein